MSTIYLPVIIVLRKVWCVTQLINNPGSLHIILEYSFFCLTFCSKVTKHDFHKDLVVAFKIQYHIYIFSNWCFVHAGNCSEAMVRLIIIN